MVTAGGGEGAITGTTSDYEPSGGGGGAGGKFRKRPFRRTTLTTPYDRPPSALRNPSRNVGSWLSKLVVDPASKLVSAGAHYFFSSVLRKRLPPPPPPPGAAPSVPPSMYLQKLVPIEANQESSNGHLMTVSGVKNHAGAVLGASESGKYTNSSDGNGIFELEQMLKQKTFTKTEIDCLIDLLNSRTVDLPVGDEDKRTDTDLPKEEPNFERHQGFTSSSTKEYCIEKDGFHQTFSTPVVGSRVLVEDSVSPAELAKAYMGSRPMKVSPSRLGPYSQAPREDANMLKNVLSPPNSSIMPLAPKSAARTGIHHNSFTTLRSRGRSAIYSMSRTPYSRIHPVASDKDTESRNYTNGGPPFLSSFKCEQEHEQLVSKQPALKRRSSVIDDDIGSSSSMRRVRQKSILLSQRNPLSVCGKQVGSDSHKGTVSSTTKPLFISERTVVENNDNNITSTSYASVPSKSSEMAAKILQHLDILSPKEKSLDSKLVSAREKSPTKLTPGMLRGKALRSLEDVDSSKLLQNAQDSHKLNDSHNTHLPSACFSTCEKISKLGENGPNKLAYSFDPLVHAENGDTTVSVKDTLSSSRAAEAVITNFVTIPQKKGAFQISAPEDSFELDDDVQSNGLAFEDIHSIGPASVSVTERREKLETNVMESEVAFTEAITVDKASPLTEVKPAADPVCGTSDGPLEKNAGFTFSTSCSSSTTFQPVVLAQLTSAHDKSFPEKEAEFSPLFSSSSKSADKFALFAFSSTSSGSEFSDLKSSASPDSRPDNLNGLARICSGVVSAEPKIPKSDEGENTISQEDGDSIGLFKAPAPAVSTSTSKSIAFSFGSLSSNSDSHIVSPASSPNLTLKNSASASSSSAQFASSTYATSSSSLSASTVTTSYTASPNFDFGSSVSSASISGASTTLSAEKEDIDGKSEKAGIFGNMVSSPFGSTSVATASSGSSTFEFGTSDTTSSASSKSQGSPFGTGGGSLVGTLASPAEPGAVTLSQSMPIQFGSSAMSPFFGTSGITSSSSSPIALSMSAAKLFGSGTAFGLNSSASSSETIPVSSSSAANTGEFTFGASFSTSSTGADFISASTDGTPSLFTFSISSASSSGANSIFSSTSAAGSIFPFGVNSGSSSGTNSISCTSGATSSVFGSSWQPNIFGSPFSSPSPAGFSFGAPPTSVAVTSTSSPMVFGASTSASTGSIFSFTTASSNPTAPSLSQSQPIFGNSTPIFTASSGNGDHMSVEDSMAEDPVQASAPVVSVFGQSPPPASFMFGSAGSSPATSFQFGGQQNQVASPNLPPFQASSSLDFSAGGSFSLGSGGGDKSNRKIVRASRNRNRRK